MRQTNRWAQVTCSGPDASGPDCHWRPKWRVTNRHTRTWNFVTDGFSQQYACDEHLEPLLDRPYDTACEPLDDQTRAGAPLFESRIPGTPPSEAALWIEARAVQLFTERRLFEAYTQAVHDWYAAHPEVR